MNVSPKEIKNFLAGRSRKKIEDPTLTNAAVLVLLFPRSNGLHVLLTKRTEDVEHHKGQISFPGGAEDPGDTSITETALREAQEEIGIEPERIEVLGLFDDHWTPSGFCITPVIGYANTLPPLNPNRQEVEEIIEAPLSFFLDTANERNTVMIRRNEPVTVYYYSLGKHEVWGATASMLRGFLHALTARRVT
jgi:8-oxo-dGTP pyrophosphatase MutT (NUDIX family)